ncbi:DNA polymerase III subunit gamma/tau [Alcaligenaceae bacterium]|nr:DNA polymerase III subunit gamma/tau [Alcaligenaceae bacterium]
MTYLVLARKWRPRSFDTLIGQDHVVRALTHALETQRLHHAWLFTGTRGVGKTTLSRILAKSLNCQGGITAKPCGVCQACTEIDTGRFVDYVELDAASNRGVDEMTQLLEQAVYAPSSGRFKVYMIDEVHMLTGHAFNAMLKTLEEPPPHVKFILATTDPQKIPVTVLSRCLQFNLKQMTAEAIVGHLQEVLGQEGLPYESPALRLLAQAASGSMRDALSLTDQAIAYSAGNLSSDAVQGMLGTIDQRHLVYLLQALAAGDAKQVVAVADELASRGLSYSGALADLAVLLSRIAIQQRLPDMPAQEDPLAEDLIALAAAIHPDLVQLFYSVAVHSRHELSLAPDEYAGFVMACLRMLALAPTDPAPPVPPRPDSKAQAIAPPATVAPVAAAPSAAAPATSASASASASAEPASAQAPAASVAPQAPPVAVAPVAPVVPIVPVAQETPPADQHDVPAWEDLPATPPPTAIPSTKSPQPPKAAAVLADRATAEADFETMHGADDDAGFDDARFEPADADGFDDEFTQEQAAIDGEVIPAALAPERKKTKSARIRDMTAQQWPTLAASLPLTGLAAELARQSEWLGGQGEQINLRVAVRSLAESPGQSRLRTVLSEHFGTVVQLNVEYGATGDDTAHAVEQAQRQLRQQAAEQAVASDPFVLALITDFGAQVVPGSVSATPRDRAA